MPGAEEKVTWKLIAIECGHVKIPRIKVVDRRKTIAIGGQTPESDAEGEMVKIVDVRLDQRPARVPEDNDLESEAEPSTILVLP